uniref:Uncharacterized protein n=1 Tax=Heterorhabditis bacteriophora TaxID=37862 RepID=A0A1I7WPX8_HETBA
MVDRCPLDESRCRCLAKECPKVFNFSIELKERCYMEECFISKRALDDTSLMQVTFLIFITHIFFCLYFFINNLICIYIYIYIYIIP